MPQRLTPPFQPHSIRDLQPKMRLEGVVKETRLHGAVVNIGLECDGIIHISQLSTEQVNRVTDVVHPGDKVTVWIASVNAEKGSIGLTMIEPPRVDWHELSEGDIYTGTVTRIERYGAFIDIGADRPGLLHIREMSTDYIRHPSEMLKVGDEVEVRILRLERQRRQIDLTMLNIKPELPEYETEDKAVKTTMEIALQRAQFQQRDSSRRHEKRQSFDASEQEEILARTLEQHSKRRHGTDDR